MDTHRKYSMEYFHVCPKLVLPDSLFLTVCRQMGTDKIMSIAHGWGTFEDVPLNISSYSDEQLSNIDFLIGGVGDGALGGCVP